MNYRWQYAENGMFGLCQDEICVMGAYAQGFCADGRKIDTRHAALIGRKEDSEGLTLVFEAENGLRLAEKLTLLEGQAPVASCVLSDRDGAEVESNRLVPLVARAPQKEQPVWKSIWSKMLLVPYDNTMWLRYEAAPLRAGRKSYDMTVMFQEKSREGLLIGALDFGSWKNAVICSGNDAKHLNAVSGVADEGSHDSLPHGSLIGKQVESARFCVLYGEDYRNLLEEYGELAAKINPPLRWEGGVPFGFNSWAGLAFSLNADNYEKSGQFLQDELRPAGFENEGTNYCNLDSGWNAIPRERLLAQVEKLHENGQKAGIYDAPFAFFGRDEKQEIEGVPGHCVEEILLRDEKGDLLPRVDGAIPYDVTHPLWKKQLEYKLNRFVEWNFDYVKLDFMSHGGMEGSHYDKSVRTGRQALNQAYQLVDSLLDPEKIGRPFFISLSIAPLFPSGYGHARRFSCDAFGTREDVEYVLNAQTYAWWENAKLYAFNDPDHICLLKSFGMEEESTEGEARARYTASVIAGTVMMLSDDYARPGAKERTLQFACNREVNAVAASRIAFRPVESNNGSASRAYVARIAGKQCVALFHWEDEKALVSVDVSRAGLMPGTVYKELWSGQQMSDENGVITWKVESCDAILLQEV